MKEVKIDRKIVTRIVIVLSSIFLLFLLIWFGFSFFSMKSEEPYVAMEINLEDNVLAEKVVRDFPKREGKYIEYNFVIILEEYTKTNEGYEITGVPYNYEYYYESRDEARFNFLLLEELGKFDFSKLEWNEPLTVTFQYRVDNDFRYFMDFSRCTLKRAYSNLFNIDNPCSRGNCILNRELTSWAVELVDKDLAEKTSFIELYDRDELIRGLFNYYITDDFGYFDGKSFKIRTTQSSLPDATHMLSSEIFKGEKIDPSESSTIQWVLGVLSGIYERNYEEYAEIDFTSYMEKIASYSNEKIAQTFLDCQITYETIVNLKNCNSSECKSVKDVSYNNCKRTLEFEMSKYNSLVDDYYGYDSNGSGNAFLLYLPSEMLYYNKIVEALGLNVKKYTREEIYSYYANSETMHNKFPSVIGSCYLLKVTEDLNSIYSDTKLQGKIGEIRSSLPKFSSLCDDIVKDDYCALSIAKKLVCADANVQSAPDLAKEILHDIFYRHYFLSPASSKLSAYEYYRDNPTFNKNVNNLPVLDEYGYFIYRVEMTGQEGVTITSFADMLDSYYFIYLLDKTNGK